MNTVNSKTHLTQVFLHNFFCFCFALTCDKDILTQNLEPLPCHI
nr:MAG TPA: hypothetical protein [Caudoviricetes sp.]